MTTYIVRYIGNPYTRHTYHGERAFTNYAEAVAFANYHDGTITVVVK